MNWFIPLLIVTVVLALPFYAYFVSKYAQMGRLVGTRAFLKLFKEGRKK
jgi:hypothetical protein